MLKPGGRFAVSDIVLLRPLPEPAHRAMRLWTGCVGGALLDTDYVAKLAAAGFTDPTVEVTRTFNRTDLDETAATIKDIPADLDLDTVIPAMDGAVASAFIRATKPA